MLKSIKSSTLPNLLNNTIEAIETYKDFGLIFTNFVDFDSEYGHRRDTKGYAEALEYFDENAWVDFKIGMDSEEIFGFSHSGFSANLNSLKKTRNYYN